MFSYDDSIVSDLYKDAFGFRPSINWLTSWANMTPSEKEATWNTLIDALEASIDIEKQQKARAVADFESSVAKIQEATNSDRKTAIRYLVDSLQLDRANCDFAGYVCYTLGIPYSMEAEIKEALGE